MIIADLIVELRELNVGIKVKDEQLILSGAKGKLSDRLLIALKDNKQELIAYIKSYEPPTPGFSIKENSQYGYFPLTAQQKSIWLATQNPETASLYNQPSMFSVHGILSIDALNYAVNKIVTSHDSLRTSFELVNDVPQQKVPENIKVNIEYTFLENNKDIKEVYNKFSVYVFDLSNPPLIKCIVVKVNDNEHYLLLNIHHIVSDGWSVNIFFKELFDHYSSFQKNNINDSDSVEKCFHFKEFVDFQTNYVKSGKGIADLDFWKAKIGYDYSPTRLSSKTDTEGFSYNDGDYYNNYLPANIRNEVNNFCKLNRITAFHFYSAAFTLLLSRYTGNNTISFGTPFACRSDLRFNNAVGCFINTLPVIINTENNSTFRELLGSVVSEITSVYNHQNYPAEYIIENIILPRPGSGSALFDIIIVYQNYSLNRFSFNGLEISFVETPVDKSKAGLVFRIFEDTDKLLFNIEYSRKLFDNSFIEQIHHHYETIIKNILKYPDVGIRDIEYFPEINRNNLISLLNNSSVKFPKNKTVLDFLDMQFKNHSGKTALSVQGNSLSYSDLDRKSNILANYLLDELKVCPNDIIAVMTDRNENLIIGIVAILKTGSAYLPVNPDYPETRKKFMLEDSGCNLVLTDDMVADQPCILLSINRIISEAKYSAEALDVKVEVNQTDPAYIIYTSGSTGRPKGVVVNHKNLLRLFFNDENIFGFNENDVWTLFHSYSFDFSVWEIFGALLFGGRLVIVPDEIRKDPLKYYDLLAFENVTVLNQTPSAFYRLLPDNDRKLSVRYVIFGGESLQPQKLKDWKLNYPDINFINMYGITETTVHVTYKEITDENINSIISNIGKPIPTLGLCILDSNFTMFPKGISGQICVYGEGLASGYLNQPELTSEKFKYIYPFGLCYLSGDLGRILENGDIEYLGRMDDQVQFHGFRIELSEIERALICVAEIKEAVVLAVKKDNDLSLHAFLVTTYKMTIDHIRRELAKYIPDYMIPSSFLFVDAIPLTPNGKTDKKALLNLKQSGSKKTLRPANKYEEIILETWKTTLGDIEISTDESFFGVGGDSIKALKLVREINKKLNTGLTIAGLYENDTIIKLAERTANKSDSVFEDEIRNELKRIEDSSDELIRNNTLTESIEQILPMSDIQRGMVYYSLKNPGSSVYHDQFVYQAYIKDFSLDIYLISLNLMIKKHSMLRTSFNLVDYIEDVQLIHRNIQPDLQFEDISGKSRAVIEKTVNDYVITERSMKFDITSPPLCRMKIFKAPEDIVILCWSFHHALLDGWSNASFITELLSFYKNILNNALYKSDLLRSSYLHYIAEQNVQKRNNEAVKFWENELAGYKRLEFPKKETDNITSLVYEYSLQIDPRIVSQLKVIASDLGTDIKTIFFSAYLCCISLLTYDNDILVGIVTNNRPVTDDSEKILGCFLNTIPFRINVDSSQTWKEYILSVVSKLNIQKKYEVLSLFEIVKHIDSPSGDSNPLFDVFFNYVDFNVYENIYEDFSLEKRGIKEYNLNGFGKTNTSLDFTVSNTFNKCALQITFDPENISYNWAKRLGDYYKRLLLLIAGETGEQKAERIHSILNNTIFDSPIRLKDIPLIDKSDIFQFSCYNNTRKQYTEEHLTIIHLYNEQLKTKKNQIALLLSDNSIDPITYSIFDENVNKLAAKILDNRNNKPGGLIGVISERNESMIYAVMAVIKSGNGYVPVDPYFPEERIKYMIEDSGCEVILCERKFKDYTRNNFPGEVIVIEDALAENLPSKEIIFPHVSESGPLFLLYTSGSTGRPKGVLMSHRPVLNLFLWMHYEYPVENERILLINPFTFDMSTWGLFAWAVNGSSVCILKHGDEKDPAKICKAVQEMSVTSIHIVPSMLSMFLDYIEKHSVNMAETQLKYIFVAGEVLFKHLIDKFNKCFKDSKTELINLYGPTEGHVDIYFRTNELDDIKHATVPIGRPIYNTKALIVDTEMRVVPPGILGEILLGGDCLADGYINKTTLTSNKFITLKNDLTVGKERFYRTGDIGRWLSDGNIEFLGRNDFQIKIRGFRVEPDEVQTLINGITGVKDSLVVGSELTPGEKSLIAYIVYESKDIYDEGFIRNELKKQVSDYMVPSVFVGIEKFPLSPNGKIDRKLLPEPRVSKQHKNIATPRNKLEEKISGIWREVLKTDTFGINDNFFDIGGHSLLIIRVQNELEKVINIKIEIVDLFNYPTIALLSDFLKKGNQDDLVIEKAAQRGENQRKARETRSLNTKRRRN